MLIIVTASAFMLLSTLEKSIKVRFHKNAFIVSIILVFDILLLVYAFKYVSFATVIGLHYFGPILVTIFSPFILDEKIKFQDITYAIIGFFGVLILLIHEFSLGFDNLSHLFGLIAALLSAFTLAGNVLYQRMYMKTEIRPIQGVKEYNFYMLLIYTFIVLPLWLILNIDNFSQTIENYLTIENIVYAIMAGVFIQALAMVLFNTAAKHILGKDIAKMSYTEVVWVIVFGAVLYNEHLYFLQILGTGLILISTFKAIDNDK